MLVYLFLFNRLQIDSLSLRHLSYHEKKGQLICNRLYKYIIQLIISFYSISLIYKVILFIINIIFLLLLLYFVSTMKYDYIGTEIIIHCSNKEIFFFYTFLQPVGWLSLLSNTEKLFFLLLILQNFAEGVPITIHVHIHVSLTQSVGIVPLSDQQDREFLCTRAREYFFIINKNILSISKSFIFKHNKKNHLQFLFDNFNTVSHTFKMRMIRRQ